MKSNPISDVALDDRLGFVGTSGSGKTYAAKGRVERLLAKRHRVVIVDPLDVWFGLRLAADGATPAYPVAILGGRHGDLPLNEHAGALIGEAVATSPESCIVALTALKTQAARQRFMLAFLDALYERTDPDARDPYHVVFDEADLWAPQKPMGNEAMLCHLMEEIVRRGRVKGFIPWLITQRPAVLNKNVLSQVDGLIALKLTASQDRDAIGAWIEGQADRAQGKEILASLPTLPQGQGVVWLPGRGILERTAFPANDTFDSSRTPKRGEKKRDTALKALDLPALKERLANVEVQAKANDPAALKAEIAGLKRELAAAPKEVDPQAMAKAEAAAYARGWVDALEWARAKINVIDLEIEDRIRPMEAAKAKPSGQIARSPAPAPAAAPRPSPPRPAPSPLKGGGGLSGPQRELLAALAWWRDMGHASVTRAQLAAKAGWKAKGSHLRNRLSELRMSALIEYRSGAIALTPAGDAAAPAPDLGTSLVDSIRAALNGPQREVFDALQTFPAGDVSRQELAERLGWDAGGSHLRNRLSELAAMEIVDYPGRGLVRLQGWIQ